IIYPNPVKEQLFIDLPADLRFTEVILTDLQSKRVMTTSVTGGSHITLDMTMPVGMYFLTVVMGGEQRTFKVVKM
ncbi:MAG TPA: T9SS type A sorting domain-containing protein, partial [Saprospiraceae bacterium]|nr:T9SS type A sorting domain-containing protein [Saprospiraceae bacterium]